MPNEMDVRMSAADAGEYIESECPSCKSIMQAPVSACGSPGQCSHCGEFMIIPKSRFSPSAVIGDFIIRDTLGSGGMGTVFLAYQRSLDRLCALKILHDTVSDEEQLIEELMREARLAAKLNHPNIVQCYAVGMADGVHYYAMEYVEGKTLKTLLKEKWKLTPARAIHIMRQMACALDYAWREQRLVHRDIKPDNIMLTSEGEAKLADFGLARPAHELAKIETEIRGTPQYICPEQVMGTPMDFRGDMYSLGAVLYQAVTGHFPFSGNTAEEIATKHLDDDPPDPASYSPDLPQRLTWLIYKLMAKEPDNRFPDFQVLVNEFDAIRATLTDSQSKTSAIPIPGLDTDTQVDMPTIPRDSTPLPTTAVSRPLGTDSSTVQGAAVQPTPDDGGNRMVIMIGGAILGALLIFGLVMGIGLAMKRGGNADGPGDLPPVTATAVNRGAEARIRIISCLPDPVGQDSVGERISLRNMGTKPVDLSNWLVRDQSGEYIQLTGVLEPGKLLELRCGTEETIRLANTGDLLQLVDPDDQVVQEARYAEGDVARGEWIRFNP